MDIPYDSFTGAFLSKITEYDLLDIDYENRQPIIDSYMKSAVSAFQHTCKIELLKSADDEHRVYVIDDDVEFDEQEIIDIITQGMVVSWIKPYLNKQELLEMVLNTRDYTTYSPAELLHRVGEAYDKAKAEFVNMMREYSYFHGDLTQLHI